MTELTRPFDGRRYAARSLLHYWRGNLAVLIGVVTGTAVLTGALIVGDSVRVSLRRLIIERLGRIDEIVIADHFFPVDLLQRMSDDKPAMSGFTNAEPAVLIPQTAVENSGKERKLRTSQVTVVGCEAGFWDLGVSDVRPARHPQDRQIVLNQPLAERLQVKIGDQVILRLAMETEIAADSTLANTAEMTGSLAELDIIDIIPAKGLGRFSLQAAQTAPQCAFLALETLQLALDQPAQINAILIAGPAAEQQPGEASVSQLKSAIRPTLEDAGLRLKDVQARYWDEQQDAPRIAFEYFSLSTNRMVFPDAAEEALQQALSPFGAQPVMTYLANKIGSADDSDSHVIPYSTVSAVDSTSELGPLLADDGTLIGPLGNDEIVLNSWAADDLGVEPGDTIRLTYFKPETTHGEPEEVSTSFRLKDVVTLRTPLLPYKGETPARYVSPPTLANDPDLTPEVPGITDQESIDDWDPPFPFSYRLIRNPEDEDYWDHYRTTPKAFIAPAKGMEIWGSRFGHTTSLRIPKAKGVSAESLREVITDAVQQNLESFGFAVLHVKADGLKAAKGTIPFNLLFLGFSIFIIAAALMLVALLSRLSIEQRCQNAGLLLAVGLNRRDVLKLFLLENSILTLLGAVVGALVGIAYASLMILGLKTWWVDAIGTPFLSLNVNSVSLAVGILSGVLASVLTIAWTILSLRRVAIGRLLAGDMSNPLPSPQQKRRLAFLPPVLLVVAVALGIAATFLGGEAQAGAFLGSGTTVLLAMLLLTVQQMRTRREPPAVGNPQWNLMRFVVRNIGRNPGRSALTIGLMAAACFLIVAVSAFRLNPTEEGTGGFDLMAQSDLPIFDNLNDATVREEIMGSASGQLADVSIFSLRLQDGDDASCRNLYQSNRPRLIGFTQPAVEHFDDENAIGFAWTATAATSDAERKNPWQLLDADTEDAIPVILDTTTARYGLQLYKGVGERFELDYGPAGLVRFEVVGLLANSMLQGSLIVSEKNLLDLFPQVGGYRFFLIDCEPAERDDVRRVLEEFYSDQGLETTDTTELLSDLLAVQNTYLSTFQSLGGLGLLLGTFGLAAVQLRNVFERRYELALLRATGFAAGRVAVLVLTEHLLLLTAGLGMGLLAALVAVVPHGWSGGARPPWDTLLTVLVVILLVGMATGALAVSRAVKAPVLDALRGD